MEQRPGFEPSPSPWKGELSPRTNTANILVPQSGFEPERARLLGRVGVPVSTNHRGSSNENWQGVKESNLLNVWIKTRCRPTWRTPNRFDPSGALHWAYARTYAVLLRRGIWYRIGDSNPSVQSESLLTSPEVECDMQDTETMGRFSTRCRHYTRC